MVMETKYEAIDKPPQTGETLANLPLLQNYAEVLNTAERNAQNGDGAYCLAQPETREVSLCYTLNSIYRDLLKWQNKQPDNPDIPALRQSMVVLFKYAIKQEFPHLRYEVKPDFIEFDTKDPVTGKIMDPKPCNMGYDSKSVEGLIMQSTLPVLERFLNENEDKQVYTEGSKSERQKARKYDNVSFGALRKMQYYLMEKLAGKQVYSFQSTEEKARAYRNTLKKQIEPLTHLNRENAANFERNQQVLSNTLDGLGMRMVWCQEPPYEAEFVNHLYSMKRDLQKEQTSPEFYNSKLPIFLNLCKNMEEFNPQETQKMSALLKEFMEKPSKPKLIEVVEETQRVALELREMDRTKSIVMRAAWDGLIRNPIKKNLSSAITDVMDMRDLIGQQNLSAEKQQKLDAFLKADYSLEEYQKELQNSKIWNVCKQVPQFANLEGDLVAQMKTMSLSPQSVADLKYDDIAFLLNRRMASKTKQIQDSSGVSLSPSDKEKYLKDLATKHEKELRKTFLAYYKKKFTLECTLEGYEKHQTQQEIAEVIQNKALRKTEKSLKDMRDGNSVTDFNAHHIFPLSNISYFERMTGKNFAEINKEIVFINKDIHDLLHINENSMDEKGRLHFGQDMACRTKYVHQDRILKYGKDMVGYYDRATMGIIMPKDGIKVMVDFNSYIYDPEKLAENVKLQAQTIEYRKAYDAYMLNQNKQRVVEAIAQLPNEKSPEVMAVKNLNEAFEKASNSREYCVVSGKLYRLQQELSQKLNIAHKEPNPTQQMILDIDSKYTQPLATVPHVSSSKVSQFLTQAVTLLNNKAKEIVMSVRKTLQAKPLEIHPEMDKARQMVKDKNGKEDSKAATVPLNPRQSEQKLPPMLQAEQYA